MKLTLLLALIAQTPTTDRVFQGRITDHNNQPITGATVYWGNVHREFAKHEQTTTDADGHYRLTVKHVGGNHRLTATAPNQVAGWGDPGTRG